MDDQGLVSVIIPTWNRERELPHAVRSALDQSYHNVEVLVCDDGSTDHSREVIASICDARVRWITGVRAGLPASPRNRGLLEAKGEWVAFMDSDDCWASDKLARQLARLVESEGRLLASCGNAVRCTNQQDAGANELLLAAHTADTELGLLSLLQSNSVITSTVILHRSLLDAVGAFPIQNGLKVGEDYAFWLRVASLTPFAFHGAPLANYADNPNSSVRASARNEAVVKLRIYRDYFIWLASKQPVRLVGILPLCIFLSLKNALMRNWWRLRAHLGLLRRKLSSDRNNA